MGNKLNPNRQPCTTEYADALADEAFHLAVLCVLSAVLETEKLPTYDLQRAWDEINACAESAANGRTDINKIIYAFENLYGVRVGFVDKVAPHTVGQAKKRARACYRIAAVLMLTKIAEAKLFEPDGIKFLWERAYYKADSVKRRYASAEDVRDALNEEYGVSISL